MSNRKLPPDAFEAYFAMGQNRSFVAVAEKFRVSKKTVAAAAKREKWQERVIERDKRVQEKLDDKAVDQIVAMRSRHLKVAEFLQRKGLDALRALPMQTVAQAQRAILAGLAEERIARGEVGDHAEQNVETIIKREYERWLVVEKPAASSKS